MDTDDDYCNESPTGQSMKHIAKCQCDNKSYRLGVQEDHNGTLDSIWYRATESCQSSQLKSFLRKQGKLSSLHVDRSTSCNFFFMLLCCYSFSIHLKNFWHHSITFHCYVQYFCLSFFLRNLLINYLN